MRYFILNFIVWLFLGVHLAARSQNPVFENINARQGLASNNVYYLQKDRQGFVWFSTNMGISRYDGYQFLPLGSKSKADGMAISEDGFLWYSNNNGLFRADLESFKVHKTLSSNLSDADADNDHFNGVFLDKKGWVWATDFHHIKVFNPEKNHLSYFRILKSNQQNPQIAQFTLDRNGNLWCVCPLGLMRFDYQKFKWILILKSEDFISIHYTDKTNQLLIGTQSGELLSYNSGSNSTRLLGSFEKPIEEINSTIDRTIVLLKEGVFAVEGGKKTSYSKNLGEKIIFHNCFVDKKNNEIWLSTDEGVFRQINENQLIVSKNFPQNFQADQKKVLCIEKIGKQIYGLGLDNGHLVYWNQAQNTFTLVKIPQAGQIRKILKIKDELYLACQNGLFVVNKKVRRLFKGDFRDICLDDRERLWMIRQNEPFLVYNLKSKRMVIPWKTLPSPDFFTGNKFNKMYPAYGKLWFAAWLPKGFGALYFDPVSGTFEELSNINDHQKFVSDYYLSLAPGKDSTLLFSAYGGFNVFNKNGLIVDKHNSEDFQNTIGDYQYFNIAQQKDGSIWIGNKEGLVRISKKRINRFTQFDGLLSNDVSNGFLLEDSLLLLGMKNGISMVDLKAFNPTDVSTNNLILSSVYLLGQQHRVKVSEALIFSKKDNSIELSFSPLNFEASPKNKFRYRLSSISEQWIENGNNPNIVFSNLEKGQYNLEVQYANISSDWGEKITSVSFEILPAWYETLWFRLILTTSILSLLYLFYRFRLNQLKKVYEIRNRISADLHDEIGASLSSIGILGGLLKQNLGHDKKNNGFAQMIAEEAKKAGTAIDYIIWNINPKYDSLESLFTKINKEAAELIEAQNIQYEFESNDLSGKNMSLDNKRNLYLMLKELINNSLKHSQSTKINLKCILSGNFLYLNFEDNGRGFDVSKPNNRNGLKNLEARVKDMKGQLQINSEVGNGTSVQLKLPLK